MIDTSFLVVAALEPVGRAAEAAGSSTAGAERDWIAVLDGGLPDADQAAVSGERQPSEALATEAVPFKPVDPRWSLLISCYGDRQATDEGASDTASANPLEDAGPLDGSAIPVSAAGAMLAQVGAAFDLAAGRAAAERGRGGADARLDPLPATVRDQNGTQPASSPVNDKADSMELARLKVRGMETHLASASLAVRRPEIDPTVRRSLEPRTTSSQLPEPAPSDRSSDETPNSDGWPTETTSLDATNGTPRRQLRTNAGVTGHHLSRGSGEQRFESVVVDQRAGAGSSWDGIESAGPAIRPTETVSRVAAPSDSNGVMAQIARGINDARATLASGSTADATPNRGSTVSSAFSSESASGQAPVQQLVIELQPQELGRVNVKLRLADGRLELVFRAENSATQTLIDERFSELGERLADVGYVMDSASVGRLAEAIDAVSGDREAALEQQPPGGGGPTNERGSSTERRRRDLDGQRSEGGNVGIEMAVTLPAARGTSGIFV